MSNILLWLNTIAEDNKYMELQTFNSTSNSGGGKLK